MSYKFTQNAWGPSFSVPVHIVEKHIKMAGAVSIKVLLWAFCNHNNGAFDIDGFCKATGQSRADVIDAMQYWMDCGILETENGSPAPEIPEAEKIKEPEIREAIELPLVLPTQEQIAARCAESTDVQFLMTEGQKKLGRTIGYDGQSTLLMLLDVYGLPVEIILMLTEYCTSVGKTSNAYIAKVGKDWSEKEIDTIEKADEIITDIKSCNSLWKEFARHTGNNNAYPTTQQAEYLRRWSKDWGFTLDMIFLAYEEMANRVQRFSFSYLNKILQNWHESGVTCPADIEKLKAEFSENKKPAEKKQKQGQKNKLSTPPSYDLDEYMKDVLSKPLVYKKSKT